MSVCLSVCLWDHSAQPKLLGRFGRIFFWKLRLSQDCVVTEPDFRFIDPTRRDIDFGILHANTLKNADRSTTESTGPIFFNFFSKVTSRSGVGRDGVGIPNFLNGTVWSGILCQKSGFSVVILMKIPPKWENHSPNYFRHISAELLWLQKYILWRKRIGLRVPAVSF